MNGLLVSRADGLKNIGDYIQSAAQEQYWDHIDILVNRENTDSVQTAVPGEKVNLIMNSWWMNSDGHFPPSDDINPLFISFHISPSAESLILSEQGVAYLKRYEPIGVRDYGTASMLEKYGIRSYFSGCLTLTLGRKYLAEKRKDRICFVDPEYKLFGPRDYKLWIRTLFNLVRWNRKIRILAPKFIFDRKTTFSRISKEFNRKVCATLFYAEYSKIFDDSILLNAEYITHLVDVRKERLTDDDCLELARFLIRKYAESSLVVTSRIHSALPCLGLETPVIFVRSGRIESGDIKGRFDGLVDLFKYKFQVTTEGIVPVGKETADLMKEGKVSGIDRLKNSDDFRPYKELLIKRVTAFVDSCNP